MLALEGDSGFLHRAISGRMYAGDVSFLPDISPWLIVMSVDVETVPGATSPAEARTMLCRAWHPNHGIGIMGEYVGRVCRTGTRYIGKKQ